MTDDGPGTVKTTETRTVEGTWTESWDRHQKKMAWADDRSGWKWKQAEQEQKELTTDLEAPMVNAPVNANGLPKPSQNSASISNHLAD